MYSNQNVIDRINAMVKEIDPSLKISGTICCGGTKEVSAVSVFFKEKGNKRLIEELQKIGFRKVSRRKMSSVLDDFYRKHKYSGYEMHVTMQKNIKE